LPQIQATLRDPAAEHNHRRAALRAAGILGESVERRKLAVCQHPQQIRDAVSQNLVRLAHVRRA